MRAPLVVALHYLIFTLYGTHYACIPQAGANLAPPVEKAEAAGSEETQASCSPDSGTSRKRSIHTPSVCSQSNGSVEMPLLLHMERSDEELLRRMRGALASSATTDNSIEKGTQKREQGEETSQEQSRQEYGRPGSSTNPVGGHYPTAGATHNGDSTYNDGIGGLSDARRTKCQVHGAQSYIGAGW